VAHCPSTLLVTGYAAGHDTFVHFFTSLHLAQTVKCPAAYAVHTDAVLLMLYCQRSYALPARALLCCSVFDPGSNPNIDLQGSNYYDTVKVRCSTGNATRIGRKPAAESKTASSRSTSRPLEPTFSAQPEHEHWGSNAHANKQTTVHRRRPHAVCLLHPRAPLGRLHSSSKVSYKCLCPFLNPYSTAHNPRHSSGVA
jgi:hypothetical protein